MARITSTTLRAIADKLEQLEKIDADITGFKVHGLEVTVQSSSDQMDGRTIHVTRIRETSGRGLQRDIIPQSPLRGVRSPRAGVRYEELDT